MERRWEQSTVAGCPAYDGSMIFKCGLQMFTTFCYQLIPSYTDDTSYPPGELYFFTVAWFVVLFKFPHTGAVGGVVEIPTNHTSISQMMTCVKERGFHGKIPNIDAHCNRYQWITNITNYNTQPFMSQLIQWYLHSDIIGSVGKWLEFEMDMMDFHHFSSFSPGFPRSAGVGSASGRPRVQSPPGTTPDDYHLKVIGSDNGRCPKTATTFHWWYLTGTRNDIGMWWLWWLMFRSGCFCLTTGNLMLETGFHWMQKHVEQTINKIKNPLLPHIVLRIWMDANDAKLGT